MRELLGDAGSGDDWAWFRLGVTSGRIVEAAGEGPGVDELVQRVLDRTLLEAAAAPGERLAADALAAALGPVVRAPASEDRVAVAMSGGVDSAVALVKTIRAGLAPVGVTLRLWLDPGGPDTERACCSPASVVAARELCHSLGVPHVTLDLRDAFRRAVVRPFVAGYARGDTPNPCVACNAGFRFGALASFARRVGAARLATGHYARTCQRHDRTLLARAADDDKDQSYMLARLDPKRLDRLWFPLGGQSKDETRAEAREAGIPAADRAESQEACFLAGADYRDFLERHGLERRAGEVVALDGRPLGRHDGFWRFTPGQRRGLGIASNDGPLYAIRSDAARNVVVAGPRAALARTRVSARAGKLYVPAARVDAKLRYRSAAVPARVRRSSRGFRLELEQPFYGVAPGQTAALYDGDAVVGAGLISSAG